MNLAQMDALCAGTNYRLWIRPLARRLCLAAGLLGLAGAQPVRADVWTWQNATGFWSDPGNWDLSSVPDSATAVARFPVPPGNSRIDLGSGTFTVNQFDFPGSADSVYLFTTGNLVLAGVAPRITTGPGGGRASFNNVNIQLDAPLTVDANRQVWFEDVVNLSGAGRVTKMGPGLLTFQCVSTHAGGTYINGGTLEILGPGGINAAAAFVDVGSSDAGELLIRDGGKLTSADGEIGTGGSGKVTVRGGNSIWTGNTITVGRSAGGEMQVLEGGQVVSLHGVVGNTVTGTATVSGANSSWESSAGFTIGVGAGGNANFTVADGGTIRGTFIELGNSGGNAAIHLIGLGVIEARNFINKGTATIDIDGGILRARASNVDFLGGFGPGNVSLGAGGVSVDTAGFNISASAGIAGAGGLTKEGAGTITLTGANTYTGVTVVNAGTLQVNGSIAGIVSVASGATLGGTGVISSGTGIADGGILSPGSGGPGTLTTADLGLSEGSILKFDLDTPNVVGGGVNDLVAVNGDLALNGTLNITALGGFGLGTYRLFNVTGAITDGGLDVTPIPGRKLVIDLSTPNQVNLIVSLPVNQPPTLVGSIGMGTYTEGDAPIPILSDLVVSDPDSANLSGAIVRDLSFHSAADTLFFTDQLGITGSYDDTTGVLTLTGTTTVANYQTALRSVTYANTGDNLTLGGTANTHFWGTTVTDNLGLASNEQRSALIFVGINDPPALTGLADVAVIENVVNVTAQPLFVGAAVIDPDSNDLDTGTLTISYAVGGGPEDQLLIRNEGVDAGMIGISGGVVTYSAQPIATVPTSGAGSGQNGESLVITFNTPQATQGAATALLQNIFYQNASDTPALTRTLALAVTDGDGGTSPVVNVVLTVTPSNDQPTLDPISNPSLLAGSAGVQNVGLFGISAGVGDAGQSLAVTATSSDPNIVGNPIISYNSPNPIASLQFTPVPGANGSATITVTVQDNGGTADAGVDAISRTFVVTVDSTSPTIAVSTPTLPVTGTGPVTYTVTYADANFDASVLSAGDITLNTTGTVTGSVTVSPGTGATRTVTISSITGDGTLGISIKPGTAADTAGNVAPAAGPSTTFIVDNSPPSVSISAPSVPSTTLGPVTYTVTYADPLLDGVSLSEGDVSLNTTGTASGSIISVTGSGELRTITIGNISGDGTIGISLAAGTARDDLGHVALAAGPSATFAVTSNPRIVSVTVPPNASYRAGQDLNFTLNLSQNVTVSGGTPALVVTIGSQDRNATYVSGSGTNALLFRYTVQAGENDADGIELNAPLVLNGAVLKNGSNLNLDLAFTPPATPGILVDTDAPDAPVITGISTDAGESASDHLTSDPTLVFTGTAELTTTVTLSETGVGVIGTAPVNGSGQWSFDNTGTTLSPGAHTFTAQAADAAGNLSPVSSAFVVTIDTTAPTITSVTPPANGTYGQGQNVDFTVTFSENVFFNISGGSPFFPVTIGSAGKRVNYISGSGGSTIKFRFSVSAPDTDTDGVEVSSPINLNSGIIRDAAGNPAVLTFTPPNTSGILVDTTPPTLVSVTGPANNTYGSGDALDFAVTYDEPILVTGTPRIGLTIGSTARQANYLSGSGSATLIFRHTVVAGDLDADGIVAISPIALNGGSITDVAGNAAPLAFTPPNMANVKIDALAPGIVNVTVPANGVYKAGRTLDFVLDFSENITVSGGIPSINLTVGSTARSAVLISGGGSSSLTFRYTVQAGETDADGIAMGSSVVLNGATIRNGAAQDATLTFTPPSTALVRVDTTAPTIASVTGPAGGTYIAAQNLNFTVNFSEAVTVTGTPQIGLTIGSAAHNASFISGNGSTALVFRYTVQAGDNDTDGIASVSPVVLNGGTMQDAAGNDATLTFTPPITATVLVDTTAPTVTTVTGPANGTYRAGQNLNFTVNFSESVVVNTSLGPPALDLTIGSSARSATYISGSGSSAIVFRYTTQAGDNDSDGIATASLIRLSDATIRDGAGNNAVITFTAPNTAGVLVDTTAPTITSVTGPANATYRGGQNLDFTVNLSETVIVGVGGGIPSIPLTIGSTLRNATFVSGSGSTALLFRYTVQAGELDNDGIVVASPAALNGGTIRDAAGNNAVLTFTAPTTTGVLVDATAPVITSVTGPAAGQYRAGQNLDFTVTYNAAVTVTGTPQIGLIVGSTARTANFFTASSPTVLVFRYTVAAGETDANGITSTSPIALNGGTIKNNLSTDATLTFTPPNTTAVLVDTTAPTIAFSSPSATLTKSGPVTFTVTYADANFNASALSVGDITLNNAGGTATGSLAVTGSGNTRTVTISSITGNGPLGISIAAGTATDLAGNAAPAAGPSATFSVDNTAPTIALSAPSASLTRVGPVTYTVTYADANFSASSLTTAGVTLNKTGTANGSLAVSGSGLTRTVTILSITGNGTLGISVAAGTAADTAGNLAPASGPSATFAVDNTAPGISISAPSIAATRNGPVTFTVTYSGADFAASTLAVGNITLNKTGTANGTIGVSGSGATRTVTVSNISGDGALGISIAAGTATDTAGNLSAAAGPSGTFVVDNTGPNAPVFAGISSDTGSSSSDRITRDTTLTISGTAEAGSTVTLTRIGVGVIGTSVAPAGNWSFDYTGQTLSDGTHSFTATATDTLGNIGPASAPFDVVVDTTAPTVSISAPSATITATTSVTFTVTYADANFGASSLTAANVTLNKTGTANGLIGVSGSGATRTVTLSGITGDGTLGITIAAATAVDLAGNSALASAASATFTVDNTPLGISISAPSANSTRSGPITYAVSYIGADFGASTLATANITLNKSGSAVGTLAVSGSGATRTVTISNISGDGSLGISIQAGTATDLVGNLAPAAGPSATVTVDNTAPPVPAIASISSDSGSSTSDRITNDRTLVLSGTGAVGSTISITRAGSGVIGSAAVDPSGNWGFDYSSVSLADGSYSFTANASDALGNVSVDSAAFNVVVDTAAPTLTISAPSASLTRNGPVTYLVTYADANFEASSLLAANITLNKTGTANGTLAVSGSGTTRTITISGISGDGALGISVAAGTAVDLAGNSAAASAPSDVLTVDNTPPGITISAPSVPSTRTGPVTYTVTYSGADFSSSTLSASDVTMNKLGSVNGTVAISGSGATRVVTISNITGNGSMGISIAAGTASDAAGNLAPAAGPSATFIIDLPPVLSGLNDVAWPDLAAKAAFQVIDGDVSLTDDDSADFNGGNVTITYIGGNGAEDQLSIRNEGTATNQIGFAAGIVTFGGAPIGNVAETGAGSGQNGADLVIALNSAAATPGAVKALIQNITYKNTAATPASSRTIAIAVNDGDGGTSVPVASTITIFPMTVSEVDHTSVHFRQTSLMDQVITIRNTATFPFSSLRVTIAFSDAEKALGMRVYDATGTNAVGDPFIQHNVTLAPGGSVQLTIEYFVPNRITIPNPKLTVEVVAPQTLPTPTGTLQEILRRTLLADGTFLIDFGTQTGARYYIQYSSDLVNWKTAVPPIVGTGNTVQWIDNGPPKTDSHPTTAPQRIYKVLKAD